MPRPGSPSFFGYADKGKILAVEEFMRDYYLHATKVEHFTSMLISRCIWREEGAVEDPRLFHPAAGR